MKNRLILTTVLGLGALALLGFIEEDAVARNGAESAALAVARADQVKATDCAVTYARTACPGMEEESYKKCDGQKSCTKDVDANSEDQCRVAAVNACANDRLTVTKSKIITAKFKGKSLKSKSGQDDLCLDYPKRATEFNQCAKKK